VSGKDLFARELEGVLEKYYALKEARQRHPYVGDLVRVLLPYPEGLRRTLAIYELEKQRRQDGLPIPASFKAAVQSSYNHYSVDSEIFKKRGPRPKKKLCSIRPPARERAAGRSMPNARSIG
jgi:hypothetical protein